MKILLVSEEFPEETNYGGIWTYHYTLSAKLSERWHKVTVLCKTFKKSHSYINEFGVKIYRISPILGINSMMLYRTKVAYLIAREQLKSRIDIIESPEWNGEIFLYYFINFIWKTKIILRLHTPLFVCMELNKMKPSPNKRLNIFIEKFLIKHILNITCCSLSLLEEIRKHINLSKKAISVINNPWNDYIFNKNNKTTDIFQIREENKINILFAWSHEYRKWVDIFAKSMNVILEEFKNVKVIFVWKYWDSWNENKKLEKNDIINLFSANNAKKVTFLWKIDYDHMPNIYSNVDICIFPSIYDNYPWVVIESLLMWKAVIASSNTWIKEALSHWIVFTEPNTESIILETRKIINEPNKIKKLWEDCYHEVIRINKMIVDQIESYYLK